ncbi:MAG: hypothetical protein KDC92_10770, partial [Bacteroidetes bacterium]|nr:hypothetical protein [Bacteroidota bacterium]
TGGYISLKYLRAENSHHDKYYGLGYNWGIPISLGLSENIAFQSILTFSRRSVEHPTFKQITKFIEIPFGIKFRTGELFGDGNRLFALTLLSPEYMRKGYSYNSIDTVVLKEQVNRMNFGYRLGVGFEKESYFGNFMVGATYFSQLTNLANQDYVDATNTKSLENVSVIMRGWYFNLTYLF